MNKGKVVPVLNKLSTTPLAYGEMDVQIHIFLTLPLAGDEWSVSYPSRLAPGETAPPCPLDTRLGGPQL
jgi:hypothetical protein